MNNIKNGIYRHYKNKYYMVIGIARHTDTLEQFTVYQSLYIDPKFGNNCLWIRKLDEFGGDVINPENGKKTKRFTLVENEQK